MQAFYTTVRISVYTEMFGQTFTPKSDELLGSGLCAHALASSSQRSFTYAASSVWNTLPYKVRASNTFSSYKSSLESYLLKLTMRACVRAGRARTIRRNST